MDSLSVPLPLDTGFFKYHGDMMGKWEELIFPLFSGIPVKYLEIEEVYNASYTNFIMNHLPENSTATCIDTWQDQDDIFNNLSGYILKRGETMEELQKLKVQDSDSSFDLIFFLTARKKVNLMDYLELFHEKLLNNNGVLVLNDYLNREEIKQGGMHTIDIVKRFLFKYQGQYKVLFSNFHLFLQKI